LPYFDVFARISMGILFAVSSITKLRSRSAFQDHQRSVVKLSRLPAEWTGPVAVGVVLAEGLIPTMMIAPLLGAPSSLTNAGFLIASCLTLVFAMAIAIAIRRQAMAYCTCFGRTGSPVGWSHVVRNLGMALVAITAVVGGDIAHASGQPTDSLQWTIFAAFVSVVVVGAVIFLDDILRIFQPTSDALTGPHRGSHQ
jgi:TRAP-type C4-dicarboxylate transport system permease small subunit